MEENHIINIKCPNCKQQIGINNKANLNSVKLTCPYCQVKFTVKFNKPAPTDQQTGKSQNSLHEKETDETEFGNIMSHPGIPVLTLNGQTYRLRQGRNTVGRMSDSSSATLQLPVDDKFMSRLNAIIEANQISQNHWYVTISSCNERNLVKVNEREINIGDRMVLQPSYVIRLGHTNIIYNLET